MLGNVDQFARKLTDSGLMSVKQLEQFCETLPPSQKPQSADELSIQLVRNKVLTEYQASALTSQEGKPLVLGDYVVLEEVGAGGMGVVFKAQHRRMKRTVALKMLSVDGHRDESSSLRFEREVEVAAKLSHINIVAALDAREDEGTCYLIMEYVDGQDLATIVENDGPIAIEKAIDFVIQAATGCAHAHEQGVIHRDIKPSNLLVSDQDVVKVLDMGLARVELPTTDGLAPTEAQLTSPGIIMGTVDFISPEQALNSHKADHRADIYSLGCTLYFLLTGGPLYPGETPMEKLFAHREQPIPRLSDTLDDVSPQLESVFQRMVAKSPIERFASMGDVVQALRDCQIGAADAPQPMATLFSAVNDGPPVVAEAVTEEATETGPGPKPSSSAEVPVAAKPTRKPRRTLEGSFLVIAGKITGAVVGGFVGASLGNLVAWQLAIASAVIYVWLGWRWAGGYAEMIARSQGWSTFAADKTGGTLFRLEAMKRHAAAVAIGAAVGILTWGMWHGIFVALTVLEVVDRIRTR